MKEEEAPKTESSIKDYFSIGEVFTYFFRKKDPNRKSNINLRMMHGVNKFSIIVFLLGMSFFIIKKIFFQ
ncbi:MAG: hypothetical protein RIG77_11120 [Cyclobacteriaceae bacterium]